MNPKQLKAYGKGYLEAELFMAKEDNTSSDKNDHRPNDQAALEYLLERFDELEKSEERARNINKIARKMVDLLWHADKLANHQKLAIDFQTKLDDTWFK